MFRYFKTVVVILKFISSLVVSVIMAKPIRAGNFSNNTYIQFKSNGDRNRNLSAPEHLNELEPYLRDIIISLQKSDTWKIQVTIAIKFISSKDIDKELIMHWKSDKKRIMHSKSGNMEFMAYDR